MHVYSNPEVVLEKILSEDVRSATNRERIAFDRLVEPFGDSLVLFGAGNLGCNILSCLRSHNIEPLAFTDNNPARWGKTISGVQVFSPQEACERFGKSAAFVVTIWSHGHSYQGTRQQLLNLGCSKVIPVVALFWKYADALLPHYPFDLPHRVLKDANKIKESFSLFADEESRRQYVSQLDWRLHLRHDEQIGYSPEDQYFPSEIVSFANEEVFVDCGAFDGDTIRVFLERQPDFNRIIAFEPDPQNFKKLTDFIVTLDNTGRSRIDAFNLAVGSERSKVRFDASGATGASIRDNGSIEVECVPLDEVLSEVAPSFLKMDIEGAEIGALIGAKKTIQRTKPKMAICVYHHPEHIWRVPLFLSALYDGYRLFLRAHGADGIDTVLYAIPRS